MAYAAALQISCDAPAAAQQPGASVVLRNLTYHPPGSESPLLDSIDMHLPANKLGLVFGRSGAGKTTLLQLLAGLAEQNAGDIFITRGPIDPKQLEQMLGSKVSKLETAAMAGAGPSVTSGPSSPQIIGNGSHLPQTLSMSERMREVGLVFQFPERHFLGDDLMNELTFTWPRDMQYWSQQQALSARLQQVIQAVGLTDIPFSASPLALSGGQQRRLALAIQLVRAPSLLLLDEPLAGLDWRARGEVVQLLRRLKQQCTLLVVSHDLKEISPLVDCAYRMVPGGRLQPVAWPPEDTTILNS